MVIVASSRGVGSCWIGDFKEAEVKRLLGVPRDWKIVSLITFGYPDEAPNATPRKSLKEIASYNKF